MREDGASGGMDGFSGATTGSLSHVSTFPAVGTLSYRLDLRVHTEQQVIVIREAVEHDTEGAYGAALM